MVTIALFCGIFLGIVFTLAIGLKGLIDFFAQRMVKLCDVCRVRSGTCVVVKWHLDHQKNTYQTYCAACENYYASLPDDDKTLPPWVIPSTNNTKKNNQQ
jgi:hypothetical protein